MPASERSTVRISTGEQAQVHVATGEQPPVRYSTGEQPPVRISTSEQPPVRISTSEQPPVRISTSEQPPVRISTGQQSPARPPAGAPLPVPVISGNSPAEPGSRDEPADNEQQGTGSADESPEALETVDLSSRMVSQPEAEDAEEPGADTTAVLETGPTVDLSSRLEQEQAERRR